LAGGAMIRRAPASLFVGQLATAVGAAGAGLFTVGAAMTTDEAIVAGAVSVAVALAVAWLIPARIFQGLIALLALCVIAAVAAEESDDLLPVVAAASTLLGTGLLLLPPRKMVEPSAYILLLFGPGLAAAVSWIPELSSDQWSLLTAKALLVLALLAVFVGARQWGSTLGRRTLLALPIVLMIAAVAMPYGGAAALLALVVAYARGAWSLATLGTLLLINATWRSYYDLSADLLAKSAAMAVVGLLLLALWLALKPAEDTT
jgi:hypothetical protein